MSKKLINVGETQQLTAPTQELPECQKMNKERRLRRWKQSTEDLQPSVTAHWKARQFNLTTFDSTVPIF
jgi:hypothetical protein